VKWLAWAQRLQAIAQAGLTYAQDPYDLERFREVRALAVEIAAHHTGASIDEITQAFALGTGYPTPKVDVRAVVFRGDEILLIREKAFALWALPGGWADVGDTPGQAAVRETREEAGYEVRATKLLAVLDKSRHHPPSLDYVYKLFIGCELLGGEARTSHETDGVGFFAPDRLPDLELGRTTPAEIARMFEHHRDPTLPTDFD
jgi:ADP-ribose pyrophosphatase YjhB (NUDIX family)